jgi:hypothetical protein
VGSSTNNQTVPPSPEGRGNRLYAHLKEQNAIQLPHTRFDEFDAEESD